MIQGGFMTRKIEQVRFAESAPKKKRVAAYARVSSGKDAMLHSLSAQVSYYSDYIQSNGWEYAGVYADEAITGTKDKRDGFQKLLAECRNGKARKLPDSNRSFHNSSEFFIKIYVEAPQKIP